LVRAVISTVYLITINLGDIINGYGMNISVVSTVYFIHSQQLKPDVGIGIGASGPAVVSGARQGIQKCWRLQGSMRNADVGKAQGAMLRFARLSAQC
jgi:hypothetical protein